MCVYCVCVRVAQTYNARSLGSARLDQPTSAHYVSKNGGCVTITRSHIFDILLHTHAHTLTRVKCVSISWNLNNHRSDNDDVDGYNNNTNGCQLLYTQSLRASLIIVVCFLSFFHICLFCSLRIYVRIYVIYCVSIRFFALNRRRSFFRALSPIVYMYDSKWNLNRQSFDSHFFDDQIQCSFV